MQLLKVLSSSQFQELTELRFDEEYVNCATAYYGTLKSSLNYIGLNVYTNISNLRRCSYLLLPYYSTPFKRLVLLSFDINSNNTDKIESIFNRYLNSADRYSLTLYVNTISKLKDEINSY